MRDPARIDQVVMAVWEVWRQFPDMRLGQLIVNAVAPREPCPEVFGMEDDQLVKRLRKLADRLNEAQRQIGEGLADRPGGETTG
jgi:hypothetical protein